MASLAQDRESSFEVHIWGEKGWAIDPDDFSEDNRAYVSATAKQALVNNDPRPVSFEHCVLITEDSVRVYGLASGWKNYGRDVIVWMRCASEPRPMMELVVKLSDTQLEYMVCELRSKFDMLQLRSDFEVMRAGILTSRKLLFVQGRANANDKTLESTSDDGPTKSGLNGPTTVIVDGSEVVLRRSSPNKLSNERPRSRAQWARRSISSVYRKVRGKSIISTSVPGSPTSKTSQHTQPHTPQHTQPHTPQHTQPESSTHSQHPTTPSRTPGTKYAIPTTNEMLSPPVAFTDEDGLPARGSPTRRRSWRGRSKNSPPKSPKPELSMVLNGPEETQSSQFSVPVVVNETSIDDAFVEQAAADRVSAQQQKGLAQVEAQQQAKKKASSRSAKIMQVMRQLERVPVSSLVTPQQVDRFLKYAKAELNDNAREELPRILATVARKERDIMKARAKHQINAIRAGRGKAPLAQSAPINEDDDDDDDNDSTHGGYLQLDGIDEIEEFVDTALHTYNNGGNISGRELHAIVTAAKKNIAAEIEKQHAVAIKQVKVETQMKTRQQLVQKMAQMRKSKTGGNRPVSTFSTNSSSPPRSPIFRSNRMMKT